MAIGGLALALAQQEKPQQTPPQEPPEEDATDRPKEYALNPLQAVKEFNIGNYYLKKGSLKAAAGRYEEATRWNPTFGDAYLKWAEVLERLRQQDKARDVYGKFLEMAPDHKRAVEIKRKLGKKA